jgi:hypothetical protein
MLIARIKRGQIGSNSAENKKTIYLLRRFRKIIKDATAAAASANYVQFFANATKDRVFLSEMKVSTTLSIRNGARLVGRVLGRLAITMPTGPVSKPAASAPKSAVSAPKPVAVEDSDDSSCSC